MNGLRTLIFHVQDLVAARKFYAQVLGHEPYFDQPFYVGFDVAGYELGLHPTDDPKKTGAGGATAYLGVNDLDAELARIYGLGANVVEPPTNVGGDIRVATLQDPFGNLLGLIENPEFAPPLVAAKADDLSPRSIVHEVQVPLPRARVWDLWASTAGMTEWLVKEAKIELRPGGFYELYFLDDGRKGYRGSESCRILSFIPGRMLSFTWNAPPHLGKTRWLHTWVVVELEDAGQDTKVRVTHLGWPSSGLASEPQWEATYAYFDRAWAGVLQALIAFARTGKRAE